MADYDLMNTGILGVGMNPYTVPGSEFVEDYNYTPRETMASNWSELDDVEAQDIERERMEELMRLASMEQYPTETEDEQGNLLTNLLNPQNILQAGLSSVARQKLGWLAGIPGLMFSGLTGGMGNLPNTMRGGLTQGGYERARQNRINEQRRRNIMQTLQSGKYAPGFKEAAFENVQDLTRNLNLVDAADVGLTRTQKPKAPAAPVHHPSRDGGGHATPASMGMSRDPTGGSPFNIGGLASLWRR